MIHLLIVLSVLMSTHHQQMTAKHENDENKQCHPLTYTKQGQDENQQQRYQTTNEHPDRMVIHNVCSFSEREVKSECSPLEINEHLLP
tara:strand:+ start:64183 stop:64446 length:264 start_codon:yes stop_codon:yes gene_type:complete